MKEEDSHRAIEQYKIEDNGIWIPLDEVKRLHGLFADASKAPDLTEFGNGLMLGRCHVFKHMWQLISGYDFKKEKLKYWLECTYSFGEFKKGEYYWLSLLESGKVCGRSDNVLGKVMDLSVYELDTYFKLTDRKV